MAPKKKAVPESGVTIQGYCEAVKGMPVTREEIFKSGCQANLLHMLDRGDTDDRFAAIGVLSVLALSEKHISEVVNTKVITIATNMLTGDHARSKLPAAQLLAFLAPRTEYSSKVADALIPLATALMDSGPGWAQAQQLQSAAAVAIKALIENIQGDSPETKHARRMALLNAGVVPFLVRLISEAPRMPKPAQYPAPPPPMKKGKAKSSSKGKGKKGSDDAFPQGRKDAIATSAAACLRFLAVCPGFVEQLTAPSSGDLQNFVDVLLTSNDAQAAYVSGIFWEICADNDVAKYVFGFGAVPALLHACSRFLASAGAKKAPSKKKPLAGVKEKPTDPSSSAPNYADMAVCNAAGALHHLTFLDEAKLEVGKVGGMPILAACLRTGNAQTYENATGALWNVGLDVNNTAALQAVNAPEYLSQPVPSDWMMDYAAEISEGEEGEEEEEEDGGMDPGSPFITR